MLSSKLRSTLRGIASTQDVVCQIGKEGLTPMVLESVSKALNARELIKINVLQNCDEDVKSLLEELSTALGAEQIATTGRKIVIYKFNPKLSHHVLQK